MAKKVAEQMDRLGKQVKRIGNLLGINSSEVKNIHMILGELRRQSMTASIMGQFIDENGHAEQYNAWVKEKQNPQTTPTEPIEEATE